MSPSSSKSTTKSQPLPMPYAEWFEACYLRVANQAAALKLWSEVLSRDQQIMLGDNFETACETCGGPIQMWRKAFCVRDTHIATVQLGHRLNLINTDRASKLLEFFCGSTTLSYSDRPTWDRLNRQILYRGQRVRQVKRHHKPTNVERILDEFELAQWQELIQLDRFSDSNLLDRDQIREAVKILNKGLTTIRFTAQKGGAVIRWEVVDSKRRRRRTT